MKIKVNNNISIANKNKIKNWKYRFSEKHYLLILTEL